MGHRSCRRPAWFSLLTITGLLFLNRRKFNLTSFYTGILLGHVSLIMLARFIDALGPALP